MQRRHTALSETLGDLEANRLLKQLNEVSYQTMTLRIHSELRDVEDQLEQLRNEFDGATNGRKWISWLKEFGSEIDNLDSKSDAEKKQYIEGLVKRIDVRWNEDARAHELMLTTHLPIVNDGITWRDKDKIGKVQPSFLKPRTVVGVPGTVWDYDVMPTLYLFP